MKLEIAERRRAPGGGRKSKLTLEQRRYIGGLCEDAFRTEQDRQAKARQKVKMQRARALLAKLKWKRHRFKGDRRRARSIGGSLSQEIDQAGRYHSEPLRRLKGETGSSIRNAIIQRIAMQTKLSHEMVRRCWIEWRAWEKRLRADRS